ncbi:uncharacterized protein APUU_71151A [Aspergillus puulaauensis]|uniref:BTB domain-containing protein n=1 Tax=Aspergillus puulaauensis TaxID=1220207 RepID=A0A7R7XXK4_9EURO|nr:uncharacterized protein APUU_71151A [Aspergillus puulaauensis]BCS29581.1 hypothetical protein APUU_71151A [Aspergillus puulaauensis]
MSSVHDLCEMPPTALPPIVAPPIRSTENVFCLDRHGDVTLEIYGLHPKLIEILLSGYLSVTRMISLPLLVGESNEEVDPQGRSVHFLLSSRHLILGSTYFAALLRSMDNECGRHIPHHRFVHRTRSNGVAFVYMLCLIHCRNHLVPNAVPYYILSDMAILVNYYGVFEAVKSIGDMWINGLVHSVIPNPPPDLHLCWVMIAWVLRRTDIFTDVTRDVITMSTDKIAMTSMLPIPHIVLDKLNNAREYHLGILIQLLNTLPATIAQGCLKEHEEYGSAIGTFAGDVCTESVSLVYNAEMGRMGIHPPPTDPDFSGLSIENIVSQCQKVRGVEGAEYGWAGEHRHCSLWSRAAALLERFQMPGGLDLNEPDLEVLVFLFE